MRIDLDLRVRATQNEEDRTEGSLYSAGSGAPIGQSWHVGLSAGMRDETILLRSGVDDSVTWYGADIDMVIASGWLAQFSWESVSGDGEDYEQIFASLSWRF